MKHFAGIAGLALSIAFGASPDRDRLIGTWEFQDGDGSSRTVWTLTANNDAMVITETQNDRKTVEVACNTVGKECELKQSGKPVKVSMWFNGPKLVVMEVRGAEVLKRRFHAIGDGGAMELELIPIVPQGKPEVVRLTRAPASR